MVKKRKATLSSIAFDVSAVHDSVFELANELVRTKGDLIDKVNSLQIRQTNMDWKQRALDLMLEQANKTEMIQKPTVNAERGWWKTTCCKIGNRFYRMAGLEHNQ